VGDNLVRLKLNDDGTRVTSASQILGGLQDPLPLISGPNGTIWVGEFGGGKLTALVPEDRGCWTTDTKLPVPTLDAGGTALDGKIYVVGGKVSSSDHRSTVFVYDPATKAWTTAAPLPGAAVENPAVVAAGGKLYAFGGGTSAFAGATTQAFRYDPGTNAWTRLPDMPQARAGATAQVIGGIGGKIYVIGGTGTSDESLNSVSILDTATATWSAGVPMYTPRDNPGSAAIDGKIYVFGGRHKLADGSVLDGTLRSVEMFDPATGAWTTRKDMPTGRRTMVVGVINGRAMVVGGEARADGGAFTNNEEYDPVTDTWRILRSITTGRHGAVGAVIDGRFHVVGGGPKAGAAFTDAHEVFTPPAG
jgi:N-acetylneuraminic acid mutarotase